MSDEEKPVGQDQHIIWSPELPSPGAKCAQAEGVAGSDVQGSEEIAYLTAGCRFCGTQTLHHLVSEANLCKFAFQFAFLARSFSPDQTRMRIHFGPQCERQGMHAHVADKKG